MRRTTALSAPLCSILNSQVELLAWRYTNQSPVIALALADDRTSANDVARTTSAQLHCSESALNAVIIHETSLTRLFRESSKLFPECGVPVARTLPGFSPRPRSLAEPASGAALFPRGDHTSWKHRGSEIRTRFVS